MWVGLLIFYVTNVTNETNVINVHFAAFCGSLSRAKAVPLHRISKRAEITKNNENNEKLRKQRIRIQENS